MFLLWQRSHFIFQHGKCFDELGAGIFWFYHFINKTSFGCQVRRGKFFCILCFFFSQLFGRIGRFSNFFFEDDLTGAFRILWNLDDTSYQPPLDLGFSSLGPRSPRKKRGIIEDAMRWHIPIIFL